MRDSVDRFQLQSRQMPPELTQAFPDVGEDQMPSIGGKVVVTFAFDLCAETRPGRANLQFVVKADGDAGAVEAGSKVRGGGGHLDLDDNTFWDPVGGWRSGRGCHDYLPSTRMTDSTACTTSSSFVASSFLDNCASFARWVTNDNRAVLWSSMEPTSGVWFIDLIET